MKMRNAAIASALALSFAAGAAYAAKTIEIEIGAAPPAPIVVETAPPPPRAGFIYEPGHYAYENDRYIWVEPRYIREREGHRYTPYVLERRGEKWHYRAGHWDDD